MKLTLLLTTVFFIQVQAKTYSQRVSFSGQNVSVKSVFQTIEKESGYVLFYDRSLVKEAGQVSLRLKDVTVETLLSEALKNKPFDFSIKNKTIFVYRRGGMAPADPGRIAAPDTAIVITGRIIDAASSMPLEGVTVTLVGTNQGTATDKYGHFSLNARSEDRNVLEFSFVGYESQRVAYSGEPVNISLTAANDNLGEVVVIGYGTVQKSDLTGAVTSIDATKIDRGVNISVDQMMQGRAPGVRIRQANGEPGAGVSVRIRGANSITAGNEPLYVIDGLPVENFPAPGSNVQTNQTARNPLNALNPGDIESIDILKDASATAIYGSRGANGVIIITTKRGKKGGMKVSYDAYAGIQEVAKRLDLMNATEYMNYLNELNADMGQPPLFTPQEISAIGKGTDWQNEIFRTAPVHNHQLSFSGGSDNTQYYVSLNYMNQQGVVISSSARRYTARLNLNHSYKRFSFGVNLNTSVVKDDYVPNGIGANNVAGVVATAIQMDPTLPVYDADGRYAISSVVDIDNPVALARTIYDEAETNRTFGTFFAEYKITDHLKAKVNFGSDRQTSRRDNYITKDTRRGLNVNARADVVQQNRDNFLGEFTMSYDRTFGDHRFNAVAGYTYQQFNGRGIDAGGQDYPTDAYLTNNLGAGSPERYTIGSGRFQNQLASYLARVNYTLKDRYLLTASFRADGSSRFGEGNKFGYFPSVALAWKVIEEHFMANAGALSDLKLRASFGVTGNQDIGNYQSQILLGLSNPAIYDDQRYISIRPSRLGNPDLKWETTRQVNAGVDFGFLGNRITGSLDYYLKNTYDLLLNLPIPMTSGFTTSLQNVGDTRNSGFELNVESRNTVGKFQWTTSFNIATVKNKVVSLGELDEILQGSVRFLSQFTLLRPGLPMNSYYGYKVVGIFQDADEIAHSAQPGASPGDLRIQDTNGDGVINADDNVILGDPFPSAFLGLNNDFSFKGFELGIFIEGVLGQELLNFTRIDSEFPIEFRRNRMSYVQERWKPTNTNSPNPSFINYLHPVNSRLVENGSFVRLKNVRLAYNFPRLRSNSISSLSVFVTGQNLITITDYTGFDPDVNSLGGGNNVFDYNAYPLARIYTFGISLGL